MPRIAAIAIAVAVALPVSAHAQSDLAHLASCQKKIASEGAKFAQKTIQSELKCTSATDQCIINCEAGVYGPVCGDPPVPPCCNPDDPNNPLNQDYVNCTIAAQATCAEQTAKMDRWEQQKTDRITVSCSPPNVSANEICSSDLPGLHFATMAAGCQATIPGWQCNGIADILTCVGGPLEKQLVDQIAGLLDPRAGDALALLPSTIQQKFSNLPLTRKVKEMLTDPAGYDLWALPNLNAGDPLVVRIETGDDTGSSLSLVEPDVLLLVKVGTDYAIVSNTTVRPQACAVPNSCGQPCPIFKRSVPFDGTFYLAVSPNTADGCGPVGKYKLYVTTVGGVVPQLAGDDVGITFTPCGP